MTKFYLIIDYPGSGLFARYWVDQPFKFDKQSTTSPVGARQCRALTAVLQVCPGIL